MTETSAPPPGFSADGSGRRRWWNGEVWTEHVELADRSDSADVGTVSEEHRRDVLDRAVAVYVLLTLLTGGLWLVVVVIRGLNPLVDRAVLTIDDRGVLAGEFS